MEWLPLFPLQQVVLPGVVVPLTVFESRYRALVAALTGEDVPPREFGFVAIRRGSEVGPGVPTLHGVGVSAVVTSASDDGEVIAVTASTRRRFALQDVHDDRAPYLVGEVTWLDEDHDDTPTPESLDRASDALDAYLEVVGARAVGLPTDPLRLTASMLDALGLPRHDAQAVLEAGDATARVRAVARLCRRERALAETLGCRAAIVAPAEGLSPN